MKKFCIAFIIVLFVGGCSDLGEWWDGSSGTDQIESYIETAELIVEGEPGFEDAQEWLADAREYLADAPTNGDTIVKVGGTVATILGVPFVGVVASLLQRKKKLLKTIATNFDSARNIADRGNENYITLDKMVLKALNESSGVQPTLDKARGLKRDG